MLTGHGSFAYGVVDGRVQVASRMTTRDRTTITTPSGPGECTSHEINSPSEYGTGIYYLTSK